MTTTEQQLEPIDPGTLHRELVAQITNRSPLMWAYDNDAELRTRVRQLDTTLKALDRAIDTLRTNAYDALHLPRLVVADLLPTDSELVQRRYEAERRLREEQLRPAVAETVEPAPFGAQPVTCSTHPGVHPQTHSCIFPLATRDL